MIWILALLNHQQAKQSPTLSVLHDVWIHPQDTRVQDQYLVVSQTTTFLVSAASKNIIVYYRQKDYVWVGTGSEDLLIPIGVRAKESNGYMFYLPTREYSHVHVGVLRATRSYIVCPRSSNNSLRHRFSQASFQITHRRYICHSSQSATRREVQLTSGKKDTNTCCGQLFC